jgi:hypothetical protein
MFRIVTQGCEKPAFLMICDNIECRSTVSADAILSELNPIPVQQQEIAFLEQCKKQGWFLSMRLCLCPGHHKQLVDLATQRRAAQGAHGGASFSAE